jgi:anion-transporting  ArsA/GET3 family ATPase
VSGIVAASKVLVVGGKGGVGKTTVGASIAVAAARAGADVLLVELEGRSSLGPLLGCGPLPYEPVTVDVGLGSGAGSIQARRIQPDEALSDYLDSAGLGPLVGRLSRSGAIDVVSTTAPGIRDLVVLGKVRQIEERSSADLVVVDAPATGHALTFLTSPAGLADAAQGGPVRDQAEQVLAMFADDRRCQVLLVTLPEETPVNETVEAAFALEDQVGIKLAPVVVNGLWPEVPGLADAIVDGSSPALDAARYRLARMDAQRREVDRLAVELPLPQILLEQRFSPALNLDDLHALADAFTIESTR